MVARMLLVLMSFMPLTAVLHAAPAITKVQKSDSAFIKLLVIHDKPGVVLEVKGKYKLYDPNKNQYLSTRFTGKRKYIQAVSDGIKWGEEFPGIFQVLVIPDAPETTTIVDGIEYKGRIYVYDIGGSISVVNELTLDDFISATLSKQYENTNLSDEAMNAIAIAARTNAYYMMQNPGSQFWAVDGRKIGYQGHALVVTQGKLVKALEATRNMVLSNEDGPKGQINSFPAMWGISTGESEAMKNVVASSISVFEADDLAKRGDHAAKILSKAYPNVSIKLIQ